MSTETPNVLPKCLLVTGAAGFIGSNLVHWILEHRPNVQVISLDMLSYAGNLANLEDLRDHPRHQFVKGNICDAVLVSKLFDQGVDAVINTAAHTHVDRSLMGADEFVTTNIGGVQTLLEAIKGRPSVRFLQVSTDEVYGSLSSKEVTNESAPLVPGNPYSASKAGADLFSLAYQHSFGLNVVITRCCNNYGPYHYPEKVIPLFITNLMDDLQIPLYGDGLNYREWIHVRDHCAALVCVLEKGRSGEIYNITSGQGVTNIDLTNILLEIVGKDQSFIRYVQDRPGHDRRYALDGSKLQGELGWNPTYQLRDGLSETVQWYREHEDWWRPIKSGDYRKYYERQYGTKA